MSRRTSSRQEASADEQGDEQAASAERSIEADRGLEAKAETGAELGPDAHELAVERDGVRLEAQASVDQDIQATVDHSERGTVDGRAFGQTLADEEQAEAREAEIARTRARAERADPIATRERACRVTSARESTERRLEMSRRRRSVRRYDGLDAPDPRAELTQDELAAVNREAERLAGAVRGFGRAAVARVLGEVLVRTGELTRAVLETREQLARAPGTVVPIGALEDVSGETVSIRGTVIDLWASRSAAVQQVGLLEDETGRTKVTVWRASRQPRLAEGDVVTLRSVARSWYEGRVSVALTGESRVVFERRAGAPASQGASQRGASGESGGR